MRESAVAVTDRIAVAVPLPGGLSRDRIGDPAGGHAPIGGGLL